MNLFEPVYLDTKIDDASPSVARPFLRRWFRWRWLAYLFWFPPHGGLRCEIVPVATSFQDAYAAAIRGEREFTDHTEELRFAPRRDER